MGTATNIDATAVNTIDWLSAADTTIVVPVYQRQYRWDIGGCEQLLADIRAVADAGDSRMHFIGSILSTTSAATTETGEGAAELVLIDGQQRITTLMLLVAALHHSATRSHPDLAADLERVLVLATDRNRTKLRPHRAWAQVFEDVVLDRRSLAETPLDSTFDDNYAFFRSQIPADEVPRIWRGLQHLEHVAITLRADANAQQIFESLNSTGEPLRDHELIHNYVLMGLSHAQQSEIEDAFWEPIEHNAGEAIGSFWRHYLIMKTGREISTTGERGVYDEFRQLFPRLDIDTLHAHAAEWREYSSIYRLLLTPTEAPDAQIARQLDYCSTFGRGTYPLLMRAYHDYARGVIDAQTMTHTLEQLQSLLLRRTVVALSNKHLVARLCRARENGQEALTRAIVRITPSDERVRVGLKYAELPYSGYVLGRLSEVDSLAELGIEHIFPLAPSDTWSGDGQREWTDYSDDEQNSHRALAETLGNLVLIEEPLAERAFDKSYPQKREIYSKSAVLMTRELTAAAWGTAAIAARTAQLTDAFLHVWARAAVLGIDDDDLTPILDAQKRRGWPRGWDREFEYVEYRGEHWDVFDMKYLFNRLFKRLWADARADVVTFSASRGGPIFETQAWNGQWDALDDTHFLYMGWDSKYMLTAIQGVLDEAGIASEVFVKYSYIGAVM
jgi:hypothetical protein